MPLNLDLKTLRFGTELLKRGFAKMQKGGVIMDVTNADQALIAEEAGAVAVMALERVPADIRAARLRHLQEPDSAPVRHALSPPFDRAGGTSTREDWVREAGR